MLRDVPAGETPVVIVVDAVCRRLCRLVNRVERWHSGHLRKLLLASSSIAGLERGLARVTRATRLRRTIFALTSPETEGRLKGRPSVSEIRPDSAVGAADSRGRAANRRYGCGLGHPSLLGHRHHPGRRHLPCRSSSARRRNEGFVRAGSAGAGDHLCLPSDGARHRHRPGRRNGRSPSVSARLLASAWAFGLKSEWARAWMLMGLTLGLPWVVPSASATALPWVVPLALATVLPWVVPLALATVLRWVMPSVSATVLRWVAPSVSATVLPWVALSAWAKVSP